MKYLKEYIPENIYGHDVWTYKLCAALNGNIVCDEQGKILYRQHGNNVVGMNNGIKGKMNRAKKYIFKYSPSSYTNELLKGYSNYISDEWSLFLKNILKSNNSIKSRFYLVNNRKIKFKSFYLRFIFLVKIVLRKM